MDFPASDPDDNPENDPGLLRPAQAASMAGYNSTAIVYRATGPSGKSYIGATRKTLEGRKHWHYVDACHRESHLLFHQAIREHGFDAFQWKVLWKGSAANMFHAEACTTSTAPPAAAHPAPQAHR